MKKFAAVMVFAVAAAAKAADPSCPPDNSRPCVTFFDAVSTTTTAGPYDLTGYSKVSVQVQGVGGTATAVITMQKRNTPSDNWSDPVITWTNPTQSELGYDYYGGIGQVLFTITWNAGTVTGTLMRAK